MKKVKLPGEVESLRKKIEHWRRTRKKISPMPELLWSAAAALAADHGIYQIARAVRIDYATLKNRMELTPALKESNTRRFVELSPPAFIAENRSEAAIDFSDDDGAKMSCRVSGRVELDVIALANAFWNRRVGSEP